FSYSPLFALFSIPPPPPPPPSPPFLHDALPIFRPLGPRAGRLPPIEGHEVRAGGIHLRVAVELHALLDHERRRRDVALHLRRLVDRKSTRLNSSHQIISYAVFCLKKKKKLQHET